MFFAELFSIFDECLTALSDLKATSLKIQLLVPSVFKSCYTDVVLLSNIQTLSQKLFRMSF